MKKKTIRIILGILAFLMIIIAFYAYSVYKMVMGSEKLPGLVSLIPKASIELPEINKGIADWPNWRGPNFNGKSDTRGIITDWRNGLKKIWSVDYLCQGNATASWASAVIQGNRLIVPGRDEKNDLVFCLNSENGTLIWKGYYEAQSGDSHGPGARATPVIDDQKVYTYGRSGDIACWQLFDGQLLWKKNVKEIGGEEPDWGLSSTPVILDDKVIIQGGGKALVIAYDKKNGDVKWKSLEGASGYSAALNVNIDSTKFLLVYHAKALSCLNTENGKEIWRIPWETEYGVNATTPAVEGNIVFHTSGYGKGGQAIKMSADKYDILWKNTAIAAQHSDPIIIDGYIYGFSGESSSMKGDFKCLELKSGKEMWTTNELGMGTCIYADGYIICFDIKGNLHLFKPVPQNFEKLATFEKAMTDVSKPAWTAPAIANGRLYLRYMQKIICYNITQ